MQNTTKKINAMIFDLDGTVLDTALDFYPVLQSFELKINLPLADFSTVRNAISGGARTILAAAFGIKETDKNYAKIKTEFLKLYKENIAIHTKFFTGIDTVLNHLNDNGIKYGLVTNKITSLTKHLLSQLQIDIFDHCIVCGDTLSENKPSPLPLLHAAKLLKTPVDECIYVGDAKNDIIAACSANMLSGVALYGYIPDRNSALDWGADYLFSTPLDIIKIL